MYAIPVLLALSVLIALVYLPRIRKPALWLSLSLLGLGGLAAGGYWLKIRHDARDAEAVRVREVSYVVDHVTGKPAHCKALPFTHDADGLFDDHVVRAVARAVGEPTRLPDTLTDQQMGQLLAAAQGKEGAATGGQSHHEDAFDPDAFLCEAEVKDLSKFIGDHADELNTFIEEKQSDPRVPAVQAALRANGLNAKNTCSDLIRAKSDDYTLHQYGCK